MPISLIFWVLMLLWLVFGFFWNRPKEPGLAGYGPIGGNVLLFILLALLGWRAFGAAIHD